ncbi:MAG: class I SAM-dependent methyltransferase [Nitrospiraceae bacterium]
MTDLLTPDRCRLCNKTAGISSAEFRQIYRQLGTLPIYPTWWECRSCRGWFVYPVPTPDVILRNCAKAAYNDPVRATQIAQAKESVQKRILMQLSKWTTPGTLLDFGCSFGEFLILACEVGWTPSGFDPNEIAVQDARMKGFDVRAGWELQEAGFPEKNFAAITANDSFCFAWDPHETLQLFYRLLQPGGVLAMRLSNKRFVLGVTRALLPGRSERDARLSRILQGQFHTISIERIAAILFEIGFERVKIEPWAPTISWRGMSVGTRLAYLLPQLIYRLTFAKVNVSPGVLLFAQKLR